MEAQLEPDIDMEANGGTEMGGTSSVQTSPSGTSLNELKSQQAKLLQQLSRTEDNDDNEIPTPNGAMAENMAATSSETTDFMTIVTSATITMPGLQPFGRGRTLLPSSWSDSTLSDDVPFCLLTLNKQSLEFQSIVSEFTRVELTIKQIQRIENKDLWDKFEFERKKMEKNRIDVNEVYLYHGTKADKEQICQEGLDQRLSRIGFFGRGIYFSNDPRKCVPYTQNEENSLPFQKSTCAIYKCRVLLGNMKVYPPGQDEKGLKREPRIENPEPGGPQYYDSVKGHVKEFDEFIIYKSDRVMPEYIISCYLPQSSSTEAQASKTSLDKGVDEEEMQAENAAGALKRPVEEFYDCFDDDEINQEIAAGALKPTSRGGLGNFTVKAGSSRRNGSQKTEDAGDEVSLELRRANDDAKELAGASRRPKSSPSLKNQEEITIEDEVSPELVEGQVGQSEDDHSAMEVEGDVYDQLHQQEILAAIRARDRQEKEQMNRFMEEEKKRIKKEARGKTRSKEDHHSVTVNPLVESRIPQKSSGSQKSTSMPKSSSDPAMSSDVSVNNWDESRRLKKETIAPEFLPVVLEVRQKVQKARQQEKRVAEQRGKSRRIGEPSVIDNSASMGWAEDGVDEVLDVLIMQFMDVTACDDIVEARACIMKANMDVNQAIMSYYNG